MKFSVVHLQEIEERKKRDEDQELQYARIREARANETLCRNIEASRIAKQYYMLKDQIWKMTLILHHYCLMLL